MQRHRDRGQPNLPPDPGQPGLQDFAACERTQPAMSSRAYRAGGVLVPSEHHIGAFHEWVSQRLA